MTTIPAAGAAPVPFRTRVQFEERVRLAANAIQSETTTVDATCRAAQQVARDYSWAMTSDVANALVNALGTGWGAIYLHWTHEQPKGR
jgi:lipopolysaccharide biosynthesis regulator YciM